MDVESVLGEYFKAEIRNAGEELVSKGAVVLRQATDKQVEGFVKGGMTPSKVRMWSDSIEAPGFSVDCSCSSSKKGQLCKHVWALLLKASQDSADFLENKRTLGKSALSSDATGSKEEPAKQKYVSPKAEEYKQKQTEFRKQAYQAQKERAKTRKQEAKTQSNSKSRGPVSESVAAALKYFEANGFPMTLPADEQEIQTAKRTLSRVFHPDKGGTHEEILELLHHTKVLLNS